MHTVLLGASRGIGYHTTLNLLANPPSSCTLLLRKPSSMESDETLREHLASGRLKLVQGDATNEDDIRKLFTEKVDLVVSSIGAATKVTIWGIGLDQDTLCTRSTLALVRVLASLPGPLPRIIAVSSMGIGDNHQFMPLLWRIIYPWLLHTPHLDKEGLETVLFRASTKHQNPKKLPPQTVLPPDQYAAVKESFFPEVIVVRPALFTGGDETALGKEKTKVGEEVYTYTIRRTEVARFIAEECVPGQDEWVGKNPVVGY